MTSKNNSHHCFSALITMFVGKRFFSSSSGTLLSSSGGIISSMDVPGGTQREDGEGGKERELSVAVPQQHNRGCGEEPV